MGEDNQSLQIFPVQVEEVSNQVSWAKHLAINSIEIGKYLIHESEPCKQ